MPPLRLERVMNLIEKPHPDAGSGVSSFHYQSPIFRIHKPFLSKSITASNVGGGFPGTPDARSLR